MSPSLAFELNHLRPLGLIFGHDALSPADGSAGNWNRHVGHNVPRPDAENLVGNGEVGRLPDKGTDWLVPFGHRQTSAVRLIVSPRADTCRNKMTAEAA